MAVKTNPLISVVVCTYNRAELLQGVLKSLMEQSLDKSLYELVVVDNASTDHTRNIVKICQSTSPVPEIILLSQAKQGHAHARNMGWHNARGAYVTFTDDDCIASPDWLRTVLESFETTAPKPLSVGGPILPLFNASKPDWFKDSYETDTWGEQRRFLKRGESFTGCNMAFQKEIFAKFGGFDVQLGMKGDKLALAEETNLYRRIWAAQEDADIFFYTPRAVMYHIIDPYKMTVPYQLKRAFSVGQASWAMAQADPLSRRCVLCMGSLALLFWHCMRATLHIRCGRWQNWALENLYPVAANIGRLAGCLGIRIALSQRPPTTFCSH